MKKNRIALYINKKPMFKFYEGDQDMFMNSKNILKEKFDKDFIGTVTLNMFNMLSDLEKLGE